MDQSAKAGWSVEEFCQLTALGRSKLYELPPDQQPASVHFGRRRVITEPPAAYLARIAEMQKREKEAAA